MHERACAELRSGRKTGHWMWFVFPQLSGLGSSPTARRYGISGADEARAYLADPVLGAHLREATAALLSLPEGADARAVLGEVDALKLRSSMTLFAAVAGGDENASGSPFAAVLDRFAAGERDPRTLAGLDGDPAAG